MGHHKQNDDGQRQRKGDDPKGKLGGRQIVVLIYHRICRKAFRNRLFNRPFLVAAVVKIGVYDKERVAVFVVFFVACLVINAADVGNRFKARPNVGDLPGSQIVEHHADDRRFLGFGEGGLHNGQTLFHVGVVSQILRPVFVDGYCCRKNPAQDRQHKHNRKHDIAAVYQEVCNLFHVEEPHLTFFTGCIIIYKC